MTTKIQHECSTWNHWFYFFFTFSMSMPHLNKKDISNCTLFLNTQSIFYEIQDRMDQRGSKLNQRGSKLILDQRVSDEAN